MLLTSHGPIHCHAFALQLEGDAIVQQRTWANTRLPLRPKHPDITELEQQVCYFKGPLTLYGDEEQILAEPTFTELLIWQSFGFQSGLHKYLPTLWNSLLPRRLRMSDFTPQTFRAGNSYTFSPSVSRNGVSAVMSKAASLAETEQSLFTRVTMLINTTDC